MEKKWYKITILGQRVNWASVAASGVLFIGLEIWRRSYIERRIKEQVKTDISQAIAQIPAPEADDRTILEQLIDRI